MLTPKVSKLINDALSVEGEKIVVKNKDLLTKTIDDLTYEAVFGTKEDLQSARWVIWETAQELGIKPASINDLYMARGRGEVPSNFSVPAMNLRGIGYDMTQAVFKTSKKLDVGAMVFELARSEMGYTDQSPEEYATVILAGAIKNGWEGPVFILGDHFQPKQESPGVAKAGEIENIKELIPEAIAAGFYNIDIDSSTLVDLDKPTEEEQQKANIEVSVDLTKYIRKHEPKGVTISIGGEIGHIGGKNSNVKEFDAYMKGFIAGIPIDMVGLSKIAIQTGTSHGGVVLPDGTLADVKVDFSIHEKIAKVGQEKYKIGGTVQHGASTLPDEYVKHFVESKTLEVHEATEFQNIMMDHPLFPKDLLSEMYTWLDQEKSDERGEDQTDEQFHYKLRKKTWGAFKKKCWDMDETIKQALRKSLEDRLEFLFTELNVINTKEMVEKTVKPTTVHRKLSEFGGPTVTKIDVIGLSD
jgi:fructose/tagatose bisphosphate aldolase